MPAPLIHPSTLALLQSTSLELPQSLLITGPEGIGLTTIATFLAAQLVGVKPVLVLPEKDEKVDIEKGVISVGSIRRLYNQTRTIHTQKQIIIIDYAERMGSQAQNAFLKLLEEPGRSVYFILATHTPSRLLSTITSRTQLVELRPITTSQSQQLLKSLAVGDTQQRSQLLFMAEGLPAELTRLVADPIYFEKRSGIVRDARQLLQASVYDRLKLAQRYKDTRSDSLLLLRDAAHIIRLSLMSPSQERLVTQVEKILQAYDKIEANGNIRLCLARLML